MGRPQALAAAPASRLARPVAGAAENAGEHVRGPVHHVGICVAARRDQADVFGNGRVGRAGPLAVDDLVKVVGVVDVGGLQRFLFRARATVEAARCCASAVRPC